MARGAVVVAAATATQAAANVSHPHPHPHQQPHSHSPSHSYSHSQSTRSGTTTPTPTLTAHRQSSVSVVSLQLSSDRRSSRRRPRRSVGLRGRDNNNNNNKSPSGRNGNGNGSGVLLKSKFKSSRTNSRATSRYGAVDDADDEFDEREYGNGHDYYDDDENDDENDDDDDEEEEDEEEEEYNYTLTPASYTRTLRLYTFVPLTAALTLLFFTLLQKYTWPTTTTKSPSSSSSLSTTLSLLLLGTAFWTVSFALRIPLFLLSSHTFYAHPRCIPVVSCVLQVVCEEILRFASIALAQIQQPQPQSGRDERTGLGARVGGGVSATGKVRVGDQAFEYVWTIALGWALAEVVVSIWQGYSQLGLYRDVVVVAVVSEPPSPSTHRHSPPPSPSPNKYYPTPEYESRIDQSHANQRAQARSELESLYGCPVPEIPVSISCLLRVDTIMLSIALFLLISFSYLYHMPLPMPIPTPSSISSLPAKSATLTVARRLIPLPPSPPASQFTTFNTFNTFTFTSAIPTFLGVVAFHTLLGLAWTPNVLPRIGLHVASYCSCIAALGALFVGLGWWDGI